MNYKLNIKFVTLNILLTIFLLVPTYSFSELTSRWEIIEVAEKSIFFIDRDSVVFSKDSGRIWQLENFRNLMRLPPQSISTQMDYNCTKSKNRTFVQYHHTGIMSKGRLSVANIEGKDDWTSIKENSKEARIFRIICDKNPKFEIAPESKKAIDVEKSTEEKKPDSKENSK